MNIKKNNHQAQNKTLLVKPISSIEFLNISLTYLYNSINLA